MNTDEKIISAFKTGQFPQAGKDLPKHIVTAISNVFVFADRAYKIYKGDNDFFNKNLNDLSAKDNRFSFTKKDFEWNNQLSPEVYLEIKGIYLKEDKVTFGNADAAADALVIIMKSIDMNDSLINRLMANTISMDDCYKIGFQFGEREGDLPEEQIARSVHDDFVSRYNDVVPWIASAEKHIGKDEIKLYVSHLQKSIEDTTEIFKSNADMSFCLDIHADNVVFSNGVFLPIDTFSPKADWRYGYKFLNIYRLATDIYVFLGKECFENTLQGYQDATHQVVPRKLDTFLILYSELISCPYQYMLAEKDPSRLPVAEKCRLFLKGLISG